MLCQLYNVLYERTIVTTNKISRISIHLFLKICRMETENIYSFISIDEHSVTPKYMQIANTILKAVTDGKIAKGYLLPSINDMCYELDVSRDTVDRAYKFLKKKGIVSAVHGKGYFISSDTLETQVEVFLLFNKLSTHKKIIYDAFVSALGENAAIDFYIYNNDFALFKKLLKENKKEYSYYVIIPHFIEGGSHAHEILNEIPKQKLILLDKLLPAIEGEFGAVYEDFEKDIFEALQKAIPALQKYHTIKIIFPADTYHAKEILEGFYRFCADYAFNYAVIRNIETEAIEPQVAYISLMENDLVMLIEKIMKTALQIGEDVGVISYNETPIKKLILNGITTISTDFQLMGEKAAELILNHSSRHIAIPFHLTMRNSL